MAWLRGQERLVYSRVYRHVRQWMLVEFGWDGALLGRMPYGAGKPLTMQDMPIVNRGNVPIQPNAVAFTEGAMPDDTDLEIGGGLQETKHTIFIDIFGETISMSKAIAGDLRSILIGRPEGCSRYLTLLDAQGNTVPGHLIHFEDVEVAFPDGLDQPNWGVVKATAVHEWNP